MIRQKNPNDLAHHHFRESWRRSRGKVLIDIAFTSSEGLKIQVQSRSAFANCSNINGAHFDARLICASQQAVSWILDDSNANAATWSEKICFVRSLPKAELKIRRCSCLPLENCSAFLSKTSRDGDLHALLYKSHSENKPKVKSPNAISARTSQPFNGKMSFLFCRWKFPSESTHTMGGLTRSLGELLFVRITHRLVLITTTKSYRELISLQLFINSATEIIIYVVETNVHGQDTRITHLPSKLSFPQLPRLLRSSLLTFGLLEVCGKFKLQTFCSALKSHCSSSTTITSSNFFMICNTNLAQRKLYKIRKTQLIRNQNFSHFAMASSNYERNFVYTNCTRRESLELRASEENRCYQFSICFVLRSLINSADVGLSLIRWIAADFSRAWMANRNAN